MFRKSLTALIATVAVGAMTLGAEAADNNVSETGVHDWTGPYIGALVGIGSVEASGDAVRDVQGTDAIVGATFRDSGILGGLTVGWNFQDGHIVYGLEGDVSFGTVDALLEDAFVPATTVNLEVKTDLFATIRGRVGVAADDIHIYGTAGLAILNGDLTLSSGDFNTTQGFTALGGVVGAGAELMVSDSVSVKAELLYAFFDEPIGVGEVSPGFGNVADLDQFYTVRFGANWHF